MGMGSVPASGGLLEGSIRLNSNKWMNISVPVKGQKVKQYFLDNVLQIVQTQTPSAQIQDIVEVVKAFPASDESVGAYLTFVPGVTNPLASGNFNLVTTDNGTEEINSFLCKMKDYSSLYSGTIEFSWSTGDAT
jgi:hypothetical protein